MFQKKKYIFVSTVCLFLLLLSVKCNTLPEKYNLPHRKVQSILGLELSIFTMPFISHKPKDVFFLKDGQEIIKSSWIKKNNAYLLNPKNGNYSLFAAVYEDKSNLTPNSKPNQFLVFANDFSVNVVGRGVFFMGNIRVKAIKNLPQDKELISKMQLFLPNIKNMRKSQINVFIGQDYDSEVNTESKEDFIRTSKKNFKNSNWKILFD